MRSKSDVALENIDTSRVYAPPRGGEFAGSRPVNGFDTETADGNVFLLSFAFDGEEPDSVDNNGDFLQPDIIWKYLTHSRARGALNVWYNLDFDANVLLSQILSEREMSKLVVGTTIESGSYEIDFIPGKFLKITEDKHVYYHYDISQFFYTSLDNAASEWLGTGKLPDVDTSEFGSDDSDSTVNQYILDNWFTVRKYARRDARLTRDLWKKALELGEGFGIPMGKPFSTGYLAESYLREHLEEKPGIGPSSVAALAWDAMKGGRFEAFKRGNVGEVVGPDINSAYPAVLQNLPDPGTLDYERTTDPAKFKGADYGFVDATVTTKHNKIQPFGTKVDSKLTYPKLNGTRIQTILPIFRFAVEEGLVERFTIHNAWLAYESSVTRFPFRDDIDIGGMYDDRKELESNGRKKAALWLKIVLNSMYGKTAQTTKKRKHTPTDRELKDKEKYVPSLSLPPQLRDEYTNGFVETLEAGGWFNPFLAAYITGMTRLELHKRIRQYGLEDATVMLATDSVMIEKDAFDATTFRDDLCKPGLGNWGFDYEGKAFVIGSGVYEVAYVDDSGRLTTKTATRGFRERDVAQTLKKSARDAARRGSDAIDVESLRPKTMAEAIWLDNGEPGEIGVFKEYTRELLASMDSKRDWPTENPDYTKLLRGYEDSDPLEYPRTLLDTDAAPAVSRT